MDRHRRCRGAKLRLSIASLSVAMPAIAVCASRAGAASEPKSRAEIRSAEAPAQKPDRPAPEDALLKDLDNELLEGAGDSKGRPKIDPARDSHPGEKKTPGPSDAGEDVGTAARDRDPLVHISEEMRSVESLISRAT
ncbi:MAG TPA: hypothetical protein VGZ26_02485, partial [Pirellulales bacterium]|nr:hypothetical protein [Pirellulales bacterium]